MTVAEQRKLAQELEAQKPVPDWSEIDDLTDVRVEVVFNEVTSAITGRAKGKKSLNVEAAVELYKDIDRQIAQLEALKKEIKEPIQVGLLVAGVEKVMAAGCPVTIVTKKGTKKIDGQKLMELGVAPMTIAKATVVGKDSQYVMIGKPKGETD